MLVAKRGSANKVELAVGDRVAPTGRTKNNLTYGYVRAIYWEDGRELARVYWPEISGEGDRWCAHDLMLLGKGSR